MPADNELHKAANKGDLEECKKWVEHPDEGCDPIDVNSPGASDRRPLQRAAGAGHKDVCEYFVQKGARLDEVDKSGRTALHWAAIGGHAEVVKLLLSSGANILAITTNGMTALHGACEAGKVDVVKVLLQHVESDIAKRDTLANMKNADNKNACEIATAAKQQAVVQALKDGGDPNAASAACVIS